MIGRLLPALFLAAAAVCHGQQRVTLTDLDSRLTVVESKASPFQLAEKHWSPNTTNLIPLALGPQILEFDGTFIYAGDSTGRVKKVRAADGMVLWESSFSNAVSLAGMVSDGTTIWGATLHGVCRLSAATGTTLSSIGADTHFSDVAFDGQNVWATVVNPAAVWIIRAADGFVSATVPLPNLPEKIAFDGTNMWIGTTPAVVVKVRASDHSIVGTFPLLGFASLVLAVCYDGTNLYVAAQQTASTFMLYRIRPSDGAVLASVPIQSWVNALVSDGASIWASTRGPTLRIRGTDLSTMATYNPGPAPGGAIFDGVHVWIGSVGNLGAWRF